MSTLFCSINLLWSVTPRTLEWDQTLGSWLYTGTGRDWRDRRSEGFHCPPEDGRGGGHLGLRTTGERTRHRFIPSRRCSAYDPFVVVVPDGSEPLLLGEDSTRSHHTYEVFEGSTEGGWVPRERLS